MKRICYSGGAHGSDYFWGEIGKEFGIETFHYYVEGFKTPHGNTPISINEAKEADVKLIEVNKILGRTFPTKSEYINNLLRRNWFQVKNSDAVYAIAPIKNNIVQGGTAWAVHMAILEEKRVYVWDSAWFTWVEDKFEPVGAPYLTQHFAGIGTRNLTEEGKDAIKLVYEKTRWAEESLLFQNKAI